MPGRIALCTSILLLVTFAAFSVDTQNANWLLYEQGNALMDQREFGRALKLYQEAIKKAGIFPEAELGIGDIYLEEGEIELAIAQYEKAYTIRKSFYIPEMQYTVQYKMASIYEKTEQYKQMEDSLNLIIQDDSHFIETSTYKLRTQIDRIYADKGLDRVLLLYGFDDSFASKAHSRLGWFYYRTGRYSPAISHLLFSLIYRSSQIKTFIKERDPEFQYSTVSDLLQRIDGNQELKRYTDESGFFSDLYYLAGSTYANGLPADAKAIWKLISKTVAAGKYKDLSARQLKKPSLEPLLNLDRYK
jgi:hypothetical protein